MANQVIVPRPQPPDSGKNRSSAVRPTTPVSDAPNLNLLPEMYQSLPASLYKNLKELLFPKKLPPLQLTSQPVAVREIWTRRNHKKATTGSLVLHAMGIAALIAFSIIELRPKPEVKPPENITFVAPISDYQPVMQPKVALKPLAGGGGGGEHAKLPELKGHLPKTAPQQFAPPTVEIRNEKPKLAVEPTIVAPPNVKLPDVPMPNLGNPMSARVGGPATNGTGSGGGIGSGNANGVGSGTGPGHGPGQGGGYGGGIYQLGDIGVTPPKAKYTPEPDFSEEARKAKYQGTVTLAAIIGPDGRPRNLRVVRSLGMGLDEKALEKVRTWLFEPGKRNGQPVSVAMTLEVDFRLF
ncbi:MAG TPA: energy transducer TonB [Candidatus Angelobacter sp.]